MLDKCSSPELYPSYTMSFHLLFLLYVGMCVLSVCEYMCLYMYVYVCGSLCVYICMCLV